MKIGRYTVESCGEIRFKHTMNCIIELAENGMHAEAYDEVFSSDECRELVDKHNLTAPEIVQELQTFGYEL